MSHNGVIFDWQLIEEQSLQDSVPTVGKEGMPRGKSLTFTLLLLGVILGGIWLWKVSHAGIMQIEEELRAVAEAELWLDYRKAIVNGATTGIDPPLAVEMQLVTASDDLAVANLIVRSSNGEATYRQRRVFQQTLQGWRRAAPNVELRGHTARLETEYFIFEFREEDLEVVEDTAAMVDSLYSRIRHNFGLPEPMPTNRLIVDLNVTDLPYTERMATEFSPEHISGVRQRIIVPYPAFVFRNLEATEVEVLAQSIVLLLAGSAAAEVVAHYQMPWVEESRLVMALRLWQLWELDLPLAAWRQQIVEWRHRDLPTIPPEKAATLHEGYEELCRIYGRWMPSPSDIGIPLNCMDRYSRTSQTQFGEIGPTVLRSVEHTDGKVYWLDLTADTVALATFIEFVVETYGRECLPLLLTQLAQNKGLEAFAMEVFGVPSAEVEVEWNNYLMRHYGTSR